MEEKWASAIRSVANSSGENLNDTARWLLNIASAMQKAAGGAGTKLLVREGDVDAFKCHGCDAKLRTSHVEVTRLDRNYAILRLCPPCAQALSEDIHNLLDQS